MVEVCVRQGIIYYYNRRPFVMRHTSHYRVDNIVVTLIVVIVLACSKGGGGGGYGMISKCHRLL